MDYSTYETYPFERRSAFNMSTGYRERCYQVHWHSYGEILVVGSGETNIYTVGRELRCCMLLMEFMLLLLEYRKDLDPENEESDADGFSADVVRRMITVTDYIKNNLTADDLSQGAMAEMAGISRDYFSRIFKHVTGMNYSKWLNMIRLEKATELLTQEDRTLTEVAMLSGFQSIPSFNRVFHEEKGMAPGEYRALLVKNDK